MRSILRRRELITDDWKYLGEVGAHPAPDPSDAALIVSLLELRADPELSQRHPKRLGVRLSPVDSVEELTPHLDRLELVAVEFPGPGDGRGFSQARILRTRLGFRGELRAIGAGVKQDLIFLLVRCGFDSFELAPGQMVESALQAYKRYTVAYQPGAPLESITRQRFGAR